MNDSYTTTITVDRAPADVFEAINDLRRWWVAEVDGDNDQIGAEFSYEVPGMHFCKMQVAELEPDRRIVWRVIESRMTFVEEQDEWVGTEITFELGGDEGRTEVLFTHVGLRPDHECFDVCRGAWDHYIGDSLRSLLTAGIGKPGTNPDEQRAEQPVVSVA